MLPSSAPEFYRSQQRLAVATIAATRKSWARMGPEFDASWERVGPRLTLLASSAQLGAARAGAAYVPRALEEQGIDPTSDGEVNPRALVGVAPDGRGLSSLLYGGVTEAKTAVGAGASPDEALARGGRWLDTAVHTLVADTGRVASGIGITARKQVFGYIRMLNPPSCSRCAVLAGKWYGWNSGFERHPHCDCVHVPTAENAPGDVRTDPKGYFNSLGSADQDKYFGKSEARAIRDGGDIGQVVNARRGMTPAGFTTEGTSKRGAAFAAGVRGRRLTPERIYRKAGDDRDEAIRLLKANAYLT